MDFGFLGTDNTKIVRFSFKNDHNDALAIAEAANRPGIQFVPIKTVLQQEIMAMHRLIDPDHPGTVTKATNLCRTVSTKENNHVREKSSNLYKIQKPMMCQNNTIDYY